MATTASPCVRRVTIPRCTTDSSWYVTDMAVRGNKLAVCGYNYRTSTHSFIDLFTLNDPGSSSQLMTELFHNEFSHPIWLPHVSFLDASHIVAVCDNIFQVYHINAGGIEPTSTSYSLYGKSARCVTVREGVIFIGLSSNEVIDLRFNIFKTITLKGLECNYSPADISVYEDNLFISAVCGRATRFNMEGEIVYEYKTPGYLKALSITVSGLVYILWDELHVVAYSLSDNRQLMSFDVHRSIRTRIVDVNRLLTVDCFTGEVREYSMNISSAGLENEQQMPNVDVVGTANFSQISN